MSIIKINNNIKFFSKNCFNLICNNSNVPYNSLNLTFYKIQKKHLYYDSGKISLNNQNIRQNQLNTSYTRNMNFVFNIGYNSLSELIETNIPILKMFYLIRNKKLIQNIQNIYIDLLEAIEFADINALDEILEKNIKFVLYNDLVKYSKNKYSLKILNKNSPIEIRFLAFNELYNIEIDREKNFITQDYIMAPFKKNKFILSNENTYKLKELKTMNEIEFERNVFEKSDFKLIALNHFLNSIKDQFKLEYCRLKLKQNASDEDVQYLVSLMNSLEKTEFKNDQYSMHLKNEFADYYSLRDKFIKEKKEKVDLYIYFKESMPNQYRSFFEKNSNKSFLKNTIKRIKKLWFDKVINPRKYIFGKKSIQVIDVEISSKMRIEVFDENGENILYSKFAYLEDFTDKTEKRESRSNEENNDYDKNYIFDIPKWKWDLTEEDYSQKHILRIEFEKLNKKLFTSRNLYKTMKITDIDLALNGNRHFKLVKDNILK